MLLRSLLFCLLIYGNTQALTVKTLVDGNWEDASTWSNHLVPTSPDSIIVSHYIVINQTLNIYSPTVVFIDSLGTICGEYLMDVKCGSSLINYGHIYLNQLKIRAGLNYNRIECKNSIVVSGCLPSGTGYFNTYPPGVVLVWPPVFCKTIDTNWEGGNTSLTDFENNTLKIYPNPVSDETLKIISLGDTKLKLLDVLGNEINAISFDKSTELNFTNLPNGIYFLMLEIKGKKQVTKILKSN